MNENTHQASLHALFETHREEHRKAPPNLTRRLADLKSLQAALGRYWDELVQAMQADYGRRSRHETVLADLALVNHELRSMQKKLRKWSKPRSAGLDWRLLPARAKLYPQALGVVGIISPWNYPVNLALVPLASAIAAGNQVMLKPSEFTPRTADVLAKLLADVFPTERVSVVQGGAEVSSAFASLPFDHLFFTGSTAVGRKVMQAAAPNLTPVTLELGGKSPAIVHDDYPLHLAAERIVAGKFFNAGQTCIAPDYVLIPPGRLDAFIAQVHTTVNRRYPELVDNPDYSYIVNQRHADRIRELLADARERGARIIQINPAGETLPEDGQLIPPTIVVDVSDDMALMQEEIFGPVLPVRAADDLTAAIDYVNERPRPLALYYFDRDRRRIKRVLGDTIAGGVCINETIMHYAHGKLPFGGVGDSGMGQYHGRYGFDTFSKLKPVLIQPRWNLARKLTPPYGRFAERLIDLLKR